MTTESMTRLSDAQLGNVMGLLKGVDSVELKVSIAPDAHRATIRGLPVDPVEAQPRQVYFFDTPDLDLDRAGIVVRARRIQGGRGDTVVKLRPVAPDDIPGELRRSKAVNIELDVVPGGYVCSASFKGRASGAEIADTVAGSSPLAKLLSKEQREFYTQHGMSGIGLDTLVPLGPTFVLKTTFTPEELQRRVVVEVWMYPDNTRILELSTKCLPSEAFQVAAEARHYLTSRGIDVSGAQQTKTRAALDYYRDELKASSEASRTAAATGSA
jgi:hypothetical protein